MKGTLLGKAGYTIEIDKSATWLSSTTVNSQDAIDSLEVRRKYYRIVSNNSFKSS